MKAMELAKSQKGSCRKIAISLIEVQKRTRRLRSADTRGGLIHSLIRNPGADRTRYVGFRLASSKATSKLCMIPHGENRISQTRHES